MSENSATALGGFRGGPRWLRVTVRLAVCAALVAAPSRLSAQSVADDTSVRAAMTEFIDALNALDAERMERCFAPDVTAFVPVAQDEMVSGRAAVAGIFRRFADRVRATTPRLTLVPQDVGVQQSGDLAVVTFQIVESTPRITRRRTFVFRREEGRWLISHMHASDLAPP